VQVEVGQLRRWTGSGRWLVPGVHAGKMFIVLSRKKTFVGDDGVTHDVQGPAWNYLSDYGEEWQWDDVLARCSEVING
jgi:hypothetical protein